VRQPLSVGRRFPVAGEQLEFVPLFEFGNLPAESGLGNGQAMRVKCSSSAKITTALQMTNIELGSIGSAGNAPEEVREKVSHLVNRSSFCRQQRFARY
jgi:hypothetical protein